MIHGLGTVSLALGEAPRVAEAGTGRHGLRSRRERWLLPRLCAVHLYSYRGTLRVEGLELPIRPGHLSIVPAGTRMEYVYEGPSEHEFAHLELGAAGPVIAAPMMQDLGDRAALVRERMREAARHPEPARRSAVWWDLLWTLAEAPGPPTADGQDSPLRTATEHLEAHLSHPLTVAEIAEAAHVSPAHLGRLFRAELGCSPSEQLRRRRMERADHLLRSSTLSIGAVAAAVGIPDLQAFNKMCRRRLGASPRSIREGGLP